MNWGSGIKFVISTTEGEMQCKCQFTFLFGYPCFYFDQIRQILHICLLYSFCSSFHSMLFSLSTLKVWVLRPTSAIIVRISTPTPVVSPSTCYKNYKKRKDLKNKLLCKTILFINLSLLTKGRKPNHSNLKRSITSRAKGKGLFHGPQLTSCL